MIRYSRQFVDDDDIQSVVRVLKSDWLTQGPAVGEFEQALCDLTGAAHAVAVSSGTAALHSAMVAAGLGPGRTVYTSPLSFAASANCAAYVGARAELVDVDPATWNMDLQQIPPQADAVIAVHYAGLPLDLGRIEGRANVVIEDAAHALGALTPDGPVGNCAHSDMCCFSFHPVKSITTGEGGAITTNDAELAARLRRFRHHNIIPPSPDREPWEYDIPAAGFNYRLSDIQAALGTSQLSKLDRFVARRNEIAERYRELLAGLPLTCPPAAPPGWRHSYHLFPVLTPQRARVFAGLTDEGIGAQVHYVPIYRLGAREADPSRYPVTEHLYEGLLSLPVFPALTDGEQDRIVTTLEKLTSGLG
ncbi:MAG: UDP-4-amino-4,6-dideoxy-N-acetyl-beta-L-altrosamine transaminase [Acidimicrobiales bacterium]|nr:MAG: aminotransferase class I/II-fold pyridoxal phosphate-dependent enzyme [Actinomycetota bacterium]MBV6509505.1 UDP-4-amino-4,6-dideoxy-N-acetyl-beta-L-altrosamine transaminase [Acidimicrobiales bacterium]RIK06623.1 MAG: UDP-4-amino-4,6-dideoxy-N-acetyl-beta-L-altrosamine transaminase [Acidobacteriota bacterium]